MKFYLFEGAVCILMTVESLCRLILNLIKVQIISWVQNPSGFVKIPVCFTEHYLRFQISRVRQIYEFGSSGSTVR